MQIAENKSIKFFPLRPDGKTRGGKIGERSLNVIETNRAGKDARHYVIEK